MDEIARRQLAAALLAALLTGAIAAAIYLYFPLLQRDTLSIVNFADSHSVITNLFTGAVYLWRFDPLSRALLAVSGPALFFGAYASLFTFGLAVLFRENMALAPLVTLLSLVFFGFDTAILGSLSWYPIFLLAFGLKRPFIPLLFLSFAMAYGNAALGILLVLLGLAERSLGKPKALKFTAAVLLPALFLLLISPFPDFGSYPSFARTFPEYTSLGGLDPLIGPAPPIRSIDRRYIEHAYLPLIVFLSLILLVDLTFFKIKPKEEIQTRSISLVLLLALFLDSTVVPESVRLIGPLYSVARMVPGLVLFPVAPLAGGLALIYLGIYLSARYWNRDRITALTLVLVAAVLLQIGRIDAEKLEAFELTNLKRWGPPESDWIRRVLHSPSYHLLKTLGAERLIVARMERSVRYRSLSDFKPHLDASHKTARLYVLTDDEKKHRWSAGKGRQDGDEWILVKFGRVRKLQAVKLDNKGYHSDFPRGIEIQVSDACDSAKINFRRMYKEFNWQGRIGFTSDGLPYLRSQSEVEIRFEPALTQCLLIKQIGSEPHYDWSVTDIQVAFVE